MSNKVFIRKLIFPVADLVMIGLIWFVFQPQVYAQMDHPGLSYWQFIDRLEPVFLTFGGFLAIFLSLFLMTFAPKERWLKKVRRFIFSVVTVYLWFKSLFYVEALDYENYVYLFGGLVILILIFLKRKAIYAGLSALSRKLKKRQS